MAITRRIGKDFTKERGTSILRVTVFLSVYITNYRSGEISNFATPERR
jgi:hypothetical protein